MQCWTWNTSGNGTLRGSSSPNLWELPLHIQWGWGKTLWKCSEAPVSSYCICVRLKPGIRNMLMLSLDSLRPGEISVNEIHERVTHGELWNGHCALHGLSLLGWNSPLILPTPFFSCSSCSCLPSCQVWDVRLHLTGRPSTNQGLKHVIRSTMEVSRWCWRRGGAQMVLCSTPNCPSHSHITQWFSNIFDWPLDLLGYLLQLPVWSCSIGQEAFCKNSAVP